MRNAPRAVAIMNRRPVVLVAGMSLRAAARLLIRSRVPGAPVVDRERRLVGLFSQRSLMLALVQTVHHELPAGPLTEYFDPHPPTLREDTTLLTIAHIFAEAGHAHPVLPVLREERVVGTITRLDVARAVVGAIAAADDPDAAALYLSAWRDRDAPFDARRDWS